MIVPCVDVSRARLGPMRWGLAPVACFAAALGLLLLSGCSEELGPERMTTTRVHGTLLVRGRPFGPAWLEMVPVRGTVGVERSAHVNADGTFRADRVPVGRVAIRVVGYRGPGTGDSGLDRFISLASQVYLIRREIPPAPNSLLTIDLGTEALAFARRNAEP